MDEGILIKPDLQFSILCDSIRREDNGKLMFIGIFEIIGAKQFPAKHHQLFIANRWIKGTGNFREKTRIINLKDNKRIIETKEVTFSLKSIETTHTVISRFMDLVFPEPGKYQVEVLLNDEAVRYYPLILVQKNE